MNAGPRVSFLIAGTLLLAASTWGIVYGVRTGLAHVMYYQAKYGSAQANPSWIIRRCSDAHRLYPHNYYFCMWAAEQAYEARASTGGAKSPVQFLATARRWCDTGLALNPLRPRLRLIKMRLLRLESIEAAVAYWEKHVDWQYWNVFNHATLVELYAESGDYEKAMRSLALIAGTAQHGSARRKLHTAWQNEMRMPQLAADPYTDEPADSSPSIQRAHVDTQRKHGRR